MNNQDEFEKRIESEKFCFRRITNDTLVCKDCMLMLDDAKKFGNTYVCRKFKYKPNRVLLGGECYEYKEGGR